MRLAIGIAATVAGVLPVKAAAHDACHTNSCRQRVTLHHKQIVVRPFSRYFDRVAWCESSGRWSLSTGNGFYGGLQFTLQTWRGVGGIGYPHWASKLEQKYRGVLVLRAQGRGAWPKCG